MSRGRPQSESQQAVRRGHFEKTMESFNHEMANKSVQNLLAYHNKFIAPEIQRISVLERWGIVRWGGLAILLMADWRVGAGVMFVFWPALTGQIGRSLMGLWARFKILITWQISDEQLQGKNEIDAEGQTVVLEPGWKPRWYHGLVRRTDNLDGFIFLLKPFNWVARFYDAWHRIRDRRRKAKAEEEPTDG